MHFFDSKISVVEMVLDIYQHVGLVACFLVAHFLGLMLISLVHVICFVLRFLRLNMFKDYFYPPQNRCIQGIFIYTFKASTALSLSYGQKMNNGNFEFVIFLHWFGALYQLFVQILIIITCILFLQASRFLFLTRNMTLHCTTYNADS